MTASHSELVVIAPSSPHFLTTTPPIPLARMSLADYLAKKYLTADAPAEKKSKKRKRKAAADASGGLVIADDDVTGWNNGPQAQDDEDAPMMGKLFPQPQV